MKDATPRIVPLRYAARKRHMSAFDSTPFVSGAQAKNLTLPQVGLFAGLFLRLQGTITRQAGIVPVFKNPVEQAWNMLRRIRVEYNGNKFSQIDVSGFDAYIYSHFTQRAFKMGAPGVGSSATDPDFIRNLNPTVDGAQAFNLTYFIPITANDFRQFDSGLINLQAQDLIGEVKIDFAALNAIYTESTVPTLNCVVEAGYMYYDFPDPRQVELPLPLAVRLQSSERQILQKGANSISLDRDGVLMQAILAVKINNSYASSDVDSLEIKLNNADTVYSMSRWENRLINRMNLGVDLPEGVYAHDFMHSEGEVSQGDERDMFDLEQYSMFQLKVNISSAAVIAGDSTIRTIQRTYKELQVG